MMTPSEVGSDSQKRAARHRCTGSVSTHASGGFARWTLHPERRAAIVPATPDDRTWCGQPAAIHARGDGRGGDKLGGGAWRRSVALAICSPTVMTIRFHPTCAEAGATADATLTHVGMKRRPPPLRAPCDRPSDVGAQPSKRHDSTWPSGGFVSEASNMVFARLNRSAGRRRSDHVPIGPWVPAQMRERRARSARMMGCV